MSKRTHQYHASWIKFTYEFVRHQHEEVIEEALDEYCRHAFYLKHGRYFFMIHKKDAVRLRLKGFLKLELPVEAEKNIFPVSVYPTRLDVTMVEKNTKTAEVAKQMRRLLPNRDIKSWSNGDWKSNAETVTDKIRGRIDVYVDDIDGRDKDRVLDAVAHWIKDGTLVNIEMNGSPCLTLYVF
ncbi:MAG: hypothetical protein HWE20_12640 [Gammaproteobacteria bacterium]|nr:hypothetical protein [Gammaproteobacteria bacterium]